MIKFVISHLRAVSETTAQSSSTQNKSYFSDDTSPSLFAVSFEEKDLNLTWRQPLGTDIFIYDKEMAQFDILTARRRGKHPTYHSGEYDRP